MIFLKAFKRIAAIVLLLAMVFSLAACGEKKNENTGGEGEYDFDGQTITIYCDENTGGTDDDNFYLSYNATTAEAETLKARVEQIQKDYNCKIEIKTVPTDIEKQISSLIASNSKGSVDIIFARSYYLRKWGNADYLVDIGDVSDVIDYTDSFRWGTKSTLELLTCNGKLIGVTPACFRDQLPPFYYVIVSNDKLVTNAGFYKPSVYLEEGTWDRDMFTKIVEECTDSSKDVYGLDTGLETFLTLSMLSNGAKLYDETTGKTGFRGLNVANGLDWGVNFLKSHTSQVFLNDDYHEKFYAGNAALGTADAVSTSNKIAANTSLSGSSMGFTLLNFPKGPDATDDTALGYISTTLNALCIPTIATDPEASAVVMEKLFEPMDAYKTFDDLKNYYKTQIYWNDSDVELIYSLADKAEYNYWVEGMATVLENIASSAYSNGANAALSSSLGVIDSLLTKNGIIENKKGFATYWDN